jgi:hypothetical protein
MAHFVISAIGKHKLAINFDHVILVNEGEDHTSIHLTGGHKIITEAKISEILRPGEVKQYTLWRRDADLDGEGADQP